MSLVSQALVKIIGDDSSAVAALKRVNAAADASEKEFNKSFGKIAGYAQNVAIGIAAVGVTVLALGTKSVKAAADSEVVWKRLEVTVENSGRSWDSVRGRVEGLAIEMQKFTRFGDEEVADTLQILMSKNGSYEKSIGLVKLTLDTAIGTHKTYQEAAEAVGKASMGNTRAFKELGIVAKSTDDGMAQLQHRFNGMANEDGKTLEAQLLRIKNATDNVFEAMGNALAGENGASGIRNIADAIQALADNIDKNKSKIHSFFEGLAEFGKEGARTWTEGSAATRLGSGAGGATLNVPYLRGIGEVIPRLQHAASGRLGNDDSYDILGRAIRGGSGNTPFVNPNFKNALPEMGGGKPVPVLDLGIKVDHYVEKMTTVSDLLLKAIQPMIARDGVFAEARSGMNPDLTMAEVAASQHARRLAVRTSNVAAINAAGGLNIGVGDGFMPFISGSRRRLGQPESDSGHLTTRDYMGAGSQAAQLLVAMSQGRTSAAGGLSGLLGIGGSLAKGGLGTGLQGASMGLSLLEGIFGSSHDREQEAYRAHLRALRDARAEMNTTIVFQFPKGFVNPQDPDWKQLVANTIPEITGTRTGRVQAVVAE